MLVDNLYLMDTGLNSGYSLHAQNGYKRSEMFENSINFYWKCQPHMQ